MRIAFFAWEARYGIEIGGVAAHVSDLAAALARQGHEVHLFTRQGPGQALKDLIGGVWYHRCPWTRYPGFLDEVQAFNDALCYYFTETESAAGAFDLLHCHDWLTFAAGERLHRHRRLIATFHTTEWGRSGSWPESGEARKIADLEAATTQSADAVIAVSYEVRRQVDLLYRCPDWKLSVIYHGIDLDRLPMVGDPLQERQKWGLGPDDPVVLFTGTLNFRKGPDILLSSATDILAQVPQTKFVFAGEGEMRGRLEGQAHAEDIASAVRFTGWPSGVELLRLYQTADVVCIPYRYDPFGIVALEGWAAQKPVVVSGDGAAAEFVYHQANGLRCNEGTLAPELAQLLADRNKQVWMGRNGRVAVETAFSWSVIAEQTAKAYLGSGQHKPAH